VQSLPDSAGARPGTTHDQDTGFTPPGTGYREGMEFLLWILAVVLVVAGIVALFRRQLLWGIVLIILGFLVGPGGVSLFT
jgi:hypothetical protein